MKRLESSLVQGGCSSAGLTGVWVLEDKGAANVTSTGAAPPPGQQMLTDETNPQTGDREQRLTWTGFEASSSSHLCSPILRLDSQSRILEERGLDWVGTGSGHTSAFLSNVTTLT